MSGRQEVTSTHVLRVLRIVCRLRPEDLSPVLGELQLARDCLAKFDLGLPVIQRQLETPQCFILPNLKGVLRVDNKTSGIMFMIRQEVNLAG